MSQKHFLSSRYLIVFFYCLFMLIFSNQAFGDEPIKIGETSDNKATAYNNSRKIVRTSTDRRIVVYHNTVGNRPVIQWVYSDNGVSWSLPAIIGYGTFPSLTIAENDWVYAVWSSENGDGICLTFLKNNSTTWEEAPLPITFVPEGSISCKYPCIETTLNFVHVVWQCKRESDYTDKIFYQLYDRALSSVSQFIILSADGSNSKMPVIANDLEFDLDWLHVLWTEISLPQNNSSIVYQNISVTNNNDVHLNQKQVLPFSHAEYPSISVRNYLIMEDQKHCDMVVSYVNENRNGFGTSLVNINSSEFNIFHTDTILTNQNPMPSVDDVIIRSCAIVWQDDKEIYYGQNHNGFFKTLPPIPVSTINDVPKFNPNVCYKTFRRDIFDVVWTEGNDAPYKIMYRRMDKKYEPMSVNRKIINKNNPENFQLQQNYPNPFNNFTNIPIKINSRSNIDILIYDLNGSVVRKLYSNKLEPGEYIFPWDARDFNKAELPSGLYFVKVRSANKSSVNKILLVR